MASSSASSSSSKTSKNETKIQQLVYMGFDRVRSIEALTAAAWDVAEAALALTQEEPEYHNDDDDDDIIVIEQQQQQQQQQQRQATPSAAASSSKRKRKHAKHNHLPKQQQQQLPQPPPAQKPKASIDDAIGVIQRGMVVKVMTQGHYGFIRMTEAPPPGRRFNRQPRNSDKNWIFFHFNDVENDVMPECGDTVEFELAVSQTKSGQEKLRARSVTIVQYHDPTHVDIRSPTKQHENKLRAPQRRPPPVVMPTLSRERGVIRRLNEKYGFIQLVKNNVEAFVDAHDIKFPSARVGMAVECECEERRVIGAQAFEVTRINEYVYLGNEVEPMCLDEEVKHDENRAVEFKSLENTHHNFDFQVARYCERYISAFLNTDGGVIYFGVADDGTVLGVPCTRAVRDRIRLALDTAVHHFHPSVPNELFQVEFLPVYERVRDFMLGELWGVLVPDWHVIRIQVLKGNATYSTRNGEAFIRRDGSCRRMPAEMIARRAVEEKEKYRIDDLNDIVQEQVRQQLLLQQQQQQQQQLDNPAAAVVAPEPATVVPTAPPPPPPQPPAAAAEPAPVIQFSEHVVQQLLDMGYDQGKILATLYAMKKKGLDVDDFNHVLDQIIMQDG